MTNRDFSSVEKHVGHNAPRLVPIWRTLLLLAPLLALPFLTACSTNELDGSQLTLPAADGLFSQTGQTGENPESDEARMWAANFAADPRSVDSAINYAEVLKKQGNKRKALSILGHAFKLNPRAPRLASAYGRLALAMGNVRVAEKVLPIAAASGYRDWRLLSALGTLSAKRRQFQGAQRYFLAALKLAPEQPTVLNNLALVYALDGKLDEAEGLLQRAVKGRGENLRLRKNLALIAKMKGWPKEPGSSRKGGFEGTPRQDGASAVRAPKPVSLRPRSNEYKRPPVGGPGAGGKSDQPGIVGTTLPKIVTHKSGRSGSPSATGSVTKRKESTKRPKSSKGLKPGALPTIRRGTYDDSFSGWSFELDG